MSKMLYDVHGVPLTDDVEGFGGLIHHQYKRDPTTNAFYTLLSIPQTDKNGNKQYPFVYWANYPNGGIESTYEMNRRKNFLVAINAGRFAAPYGAGVTLTGLPKGTVIQNSVVLQQGTSENANATMDWVLTIDNMGVLGYAKPTASASDMVHNGIVSAVAGFIPILTNYVSIEDVESEDIGYVERTEDSQRQVIGQYDNGDYVVITAEGRGYQGGGWFTVRQTIDLCKSLGIKNAFMLDGGGSTETVVKKKQLNPFYDNTYGRVVPTYIIFNGTTSFPG